MESKDIFWRISKEALRRFSGGEAFTFGAALSFYTLLSLVPLLMLLLTLTGIFVGSEAIQQELLRKTNTLLGPLARDTVAGVLEHAEQTAVVVRTSFFGATAFFSQLQTALNQIWGVRPAPEAIVPKHTWPGGIGYLPAQTLGESGRQVISWKQRTYFRPTAGFSEP